MRCAHYHNNSTDSRCTAHADVWLTAPDGKPNPGGWSCRKHADAVVQEYQAKLNEPWSYYEIDDNGDRL